MHEPKPLVYVAGPFSHPDPIANTHEAIRQAEIIEAMGAAVLIPHLSLAWHLVSPAPVEKWYERDLHHLARCDALVRLPEESSGADAEVEYARESGIPVFFWEIPWDTPGELTRVALAEWIGAWPTVYP